MYCDGVCRSMDDFELVRLLGGGHLSSVALASCSRSGLQVVIKIYHRDRMTALNEKQVSTSMVRIVQIVSVLRSKVTYHAYAETFPMT
jgi:hypothetical protein